MDQGDLVLGVDGGGSKTVAWLAVVDAETGADVIGRGRSGPSNCRSVGNTRAIENLDQSIALAFGDANRNRSPVARACFSLAGADRPSEKRTFQAWADSQNIANDLTITNDAIAVLYAATIEGVGVALISGTGSVAVGRSASGETARCGGWGGLLGDEGSGYQIALAGLRAATRAADGRGPDTLLLQRFLDHFQIDDAAELIPAIYAPEPDRATLARLAPFVFESAELHDNIAASIIDHAANDLSELAVTLSTRLGLNTSPLVLGVSGGVLLNQPPMIDKVVSRIVESGVEQVEVKPVEEPVAGALNLALARKG